MKRSDPAWIHRRIAWLFERAEACGMHEPPTLANGYAEPGYSNPESGVVAFANWNSTEGWNEPKTKRHMTMPRVANLLGKLGVEIEWSDEWKVCKDCGKAVRVEPDSYSWTRSCIDADEGVLCQDCVLKDPQWYLEEIEGDDSRCVTINIDLEHQGYKLLQGNFEHGLHEGQADNPRKIGQALRDIGVTRYLFALDCAGQFDIEFSVWVHGDEWEKVQKHMDEWEAAGKQSDVSPARAMQAALASASVQIDKLEGEGARVATCHADGTATVRLVSPQNFMDGKALD